MEADQEAVARFDADTSDNNKLTPLQAGDRSLPGWNQKMGSCHKLVLVNKSLSTLNFVCLSAR